ncbi:hypothetical protein AcV7_006342 [Taiwanofungus camphoratus]|nr:hypothetical protein AcV7_006342 [Antrodia cinnamomea]
MLQSRSGKTTFINLASGSQLRVGAGLESVTDSIQRSEEFLLNKYKITLIDTPGFDDTTKSDAEILDIITTFLSTMHKEKKRLNGIIYLYRITDNRMSGTALRNFRLFLELCGKSFLPNTAIVLNMWNEVNEEIRLSRREELRSIFFKAALDAGARMFTHDNHVDSSHTILRYLAAKRPRLLQIQKELVDQRKHVCETKAGIALLGDLAEKERKHQLQLRELSKELEEAIRQRDEIDRRELEEAVLRLQEASHRIVLEQGKIQADKENTKHVSRQAETRQHPRRLTSCTRAGSLEC